MRLFTFTKMSESSMIASVRIARFVSERLKIPVITDETIGEGRDDLLIIVNGAYAFCKCLPALGAAIDRAERVAWIQNDYTIIPPKPVSEAESPFRKAFRNRRERGQPDVDFWTTCEDWVRLTPGSCYVNWNCLTFDEDYHPKKIRRRRQTAGGDLLYYGSWRGGGGRSSREIYFDRYFREPQVDVTISSPAKQFGRYEKVACVSPVREKFYESIGSHGAGLYVEDRMSHDHYHSPANRFYEMLSAGLPILFQPECGYGLRKAGYDPTLFYCKTPREVAAMMHRREAIGEEQRRMWSDRAALERADLPNKLDKAIEKVFLREKAS